PRRTVLGPQRSDHRLWAFWRLSSLVWAEDVGGRHEGKTGLPCESCNPHKALDSRLLPRNHDWLTSLPLYRLVCAQCTVAHAFEQNLVEHKNLYISAACVP
ncbi:hypothetical protein BDZ89DRAFT_1116952, partial [Hymenopellis radicata]